MPDKDPIVEIADLEVLDSFRPISLSEMEGVSLMSRMDTKYIIPIDKLAVLLDRLKVLYRVLEIDGSRIFDYRTDYYDTEGFEMYEAHHNGKLNRFKVRHREYVASGKVFLEIKFKNNKKRTIKKRIEQVEGEGLSESEITFLEHNSPFKNDQLELKLTNRFRRITLVGESERLTIDSGLWFSSPHETEASYPNIAIVEFKQEKFNIQSPGIQCLKEMGLRPESCSKYCLGTASTNETVKTNRLKEKLAYIGKL